jgi:hypothetical protein
MEKRKWKMGPRGLGAEMEKRKWKMGGAENPNALLLGGIPNF